MAEDEEEAKIISVSLRGGEAQHERWKEAAGKYYAGNLSSMIVNLIEEYIEKKSSDTPEFPDLRGAVDKAYDESKTTRETIEGLKIRLRDQEDCSRERGAAKEILDFNLKEGDMTIAEIHSKFEPEYKTEVIDGALALLMDLDLGDIKLKDSNGGEKEA